MNGNTGHWTASAWDLTTRELYHFDAARVERLRDAYKTASEEAGGMRTAADVDGMRREPLHFRVGG